MLYFDGTMTLLYNNKCNLKSLISLTSSLCALQAQFQLLQPPGICVWWWVALKKKEGMDSTELLVSSLQTAAVKHSRIVKLLKERGKSPPQATCQRHKGYIKMQIFSFILNEWDYFE